MAKTKLRLRKNIAVIKNIGLQTGIWNYYNIT